MAIKKGHNAEKLAHYLAKYFVKSASDPRFKGKRLYFTSRKIDRPFELLNEDFTKYQNRDKFTVCENRTSQSLEGFVKIIKYYEN